MIIKVKVFPNSKEEEIVQKAEDSFEVKVREKPVQGRANREVARVLSSYFNVSPANVRLIKGFRERNKMFEVKI